MDTLKYLKKGGRITPAAAALGTLLKIKPVLTIQGEKLDAFAKARTMKQAKSIMLTAVKKDLEERFADPEGAGPTWRSLTRIMRRQLELKKELMELFPKAGDLCGSLILKRVLPYRPGRAGSCLYEEAVL